MKAGRLLLIPLAGLVLVAVAAQDRSPRVFRHRGGPAVRFDPERALRAVEDLERELAQARPVSRRVSLSLEDPFDGGLPSCPARMERILEIPVPPRLAGKTVLWTRAAGEADAVFRTEAGSLKELIRSGALPGEASAAAAWGVRCVPSRVTFRSPNVVRIEEGP